VNRPADANVKLNRAPGVILPEAHWPASADDVWVVLSSLSQLIVVPAVIVSGFAPKAVVVRIDAPPGIVTLVLPGGAGVGPAEGADGALDPPHAVIAAEIVSIAAKRKDMISSCAPRSAAANLRASSRFNFETRPNIPGSSGISCGASPILRRIDPAAESTKASAGARRPAERELLAQSVEPRRTTESTGQN